MIPNQNIQVYFYIHFNFYQILRFIFHYGKYPIETVDLNCTDQSSYVSTIRDIGGINRAPLAQMKAIKPINQSINQEDIQIIICLASLTYNPILQIRAFLAS